MLPIGTRSAFKNRWWALLWAAGIIWFAYDFAGAAPQDDGNGVTTDATGAPVTADDANKVGQLIDN